MSHRRQGDSRSPFVFLILYDVRTCLEQDVFCGRKATVKEINTEIRRKFYPSIEREGKESDSRTRGLELVASVSAAFDSAAVDADGASLCAFQKYRHNDRKQPKSYNSRLLLTTPLSHSFYLIIV